MNGLFRRVFLLMLACCIGLTGLAQQKKPCRHFEKSDFSREDSSSLAEAWGQNKILPPHYALAALVALSYFPELKQTRIEFVTKHTYSPLKTVPVFPNLVGNRSKRKFVITISDSSIDKLEPILLKQMDFNAQIGVIGHELSHAADFSDRHLGSLVGSGIGHVSSSYIDRFEYRTDSICIAHGLGFQLLAWSRFVRKQLNTVNYDGSDNINMPVMDHERYMNPNTILKRLEADPAYSEALRE
jgi:hypothetical protein